MACPIALEWLCGPAGAVTQAVGGGIISQIAASAQHAQVTILADMLPLWTKIPTPAATGGPVTFLRQDTSWLVGFGAVLGLLIAAGHLAWSRRAEPAKAAAAGLVRLVVVTGASAAVITLGAQAGDAYSKWIIGQSLARAGGGSLLSEGEALASLASASALPAFLLLILAIVGIIACIVQIILLVVRIAMLGLLAGVLPVTAAMSGTQRGQEWFDRATRWLLAYLIYKPAAATIFAYAFVSLTAKDAVDQISGLAVVILAVAALPALLRFLAPMVTAVTGSGGAGGGAAAMAGAALATGARLIPLPGAAGAGAAAAAAGNGRSGAAGAAQAAGAVGSVSATGAGPAQAQPTAPGSSGPPGSGPVGPQGATGIPGPGGAQGRPAGEHSGGGEGPSGSR
jgi:hypothetical protein